MNVGYVRVSMYLCLYNYSSVPCSKQIYQILSVLSFLSQDYHILLGFEYLGKTFVNCRGNIVTYILRNRATSRFNEA